MRAGPAGPPGSPAGAQRLNVVVALEQVELDVWVPLRDVTLEVAEATGLPPAVVTDALLWLADRGQKVERRRVGGQEQLRWIQRRGHCMTGPAR